MKFIAFAALLLATAAPAIIHAAPATVAAAVARSDRKADDLKLDASRKPVAVLSFLGLRTGDRVLDVMAGGGYYTDIVAHAVGPKGMVIAYEPESFLASDKAKANWAALKAHDANVALMTPLPSNLALAPNSFDFVLFHLTYHDLYWESAEYHWPRTDPASFLAKVFAATKPGGIVGVVDHVATPGDTRVTVDKLHRIDPAVLKADFLAAGFVLDGESDLLRVTEDDHSKLVFDPAVRGKTDRVVYRFKKPG